MKKNSFWSIVLVLILISCQIQSAFNFVIAGNVIVNTNIVYGSAWNEATQKTESLKLDAYQLAKGDQTSRPVIILVHGGGFGGGTKGYSEWQGNFYPDMATAYANAGYVAFSIDYRIWPNCPSNRFREELDYTVEDVIMALNWIKANFVTYGVDTTKVIIGGDSAGGGIVVNASYRSENAVLFKGCIDLWGGLPPYGTSGQNPVNACSVTASVPKTCMIHGTLDDIVPYFISENLSNALNGVGVYNELHSLDGLKHYPINLSPAPEDYQNDLASEIVDIMLTFSNQILNFSPTRLNETIIDTIGIFPNPVKNGKLTINFGSLIENGTISVVDLSGRELIKSEIKGEDKKNIIVTGLGKGMYIIKIIIGKASFEKKIVID